MNTGVGVVCLHCSDASFTYMAFTKQYGVFWNKKYLPFSLRLSLGLVSSSFLFRWVVDNLAKRSHFLWPQIYAVRRGNHKSILLCPWCQESLLNYRDTPHGALAGTVFLLLGGKHVPSVCLLTSWSEQGCQHRTSSQLEMLLLDLANAGHQKRTFCNKQRRGVKILQMGFWGSNLMN